MSGGKQGGACDCGVCADVIPVSGRGASLLQPSESGVYIQPGGVRGSNRVKCNGSAEKMKRVPWALQVQSISIHGDQSSWRNSLAKWINNTYMAPAGNTTRGCVVNARRGLYRWDVEHERSGQQAGGGCEEARSGEHQVRNCVTG